MNHYIRRRIRLMLLFLLVLSPVGIALAHGVPEIAVDPTVCAAGSMITITGSAMEDGNTYTITLEGIKGSTPLGVTTAKSESGSEEAGFVVQYTVPASTAPGSYTVRAVTPDGDVATADLTVTAAAAQASAGPAMSQMASAEPHILDRTKPAGQIFVVAVVILLSAAGGLVLVRRKA